MAAQPLTYIDDLAVGAASVASQRAQLAAYDFPGVFTPDVCFRISNTLRFQDELMKRIENSATQYRLSVGVELPKGAMVRVPPDFNQMLLNFNKYFEIFCKNDPIAFNHNGRTLIVCVDAAGTAQLAAPQTIAQFIQYASVGASQYQINDALEYILNRDDNDNVHEKYAMPIILFTARGVNVGDVILGPSDIGQKFGNGGVVVVGASPSVFPGGYDFNNLTQVYANSEKKMIGGVDSGILNTKYSFPNFLLGEMLYKAPGAKEATGVCKMFKGEGAMEFWIKNYPGIYFPYDPTKYFFPNGWKLIERADGVIMYFNTETNNVESNFPMGSYYIRPQGSALNTVIKDSARYNAIDTAVSNAAAQFSPAQMSDPNVQRILQLVAYMTNLDEIKRSFRIVPGGGGGKKKTKRTNIIKYMAKSKKKHHK